MTAPDRRIKKYCCEDISKIKNYKEAKADPVRIWEVHHLKENEGKTPSQLKKINEYYNRPADELIFLHREEHRKLHNSMRLGENNPNFGKKRSADTRLKTSKSMRKSICPLLVITLINIQKKSYSAAARELGCSVQTVRRRFLELIDK